MKLSISNLSFTGFDYALMKQLPDNLGLELFWEFGNPYYWEQAMRHLTDNRPLLELSVHGPSVGVNLASRSDTHYLSLYRQAFQFAGKWQARFLVAHTNEAFGGSPEEARRLVRSRLAELILISRKEKIPLLIENVGVKRQNTLLFDCPDYLDLLAALPQAGAIIDTGHALLNNWDLPAVIRQLGGRIKAYHLHDNHGLYDEHLPAGEGQLDWKALFSAIQAFSPDATLVLEYANTTLEALLANMHSAVFRNVTPNRC